MMEEINTITETLAKMGCFTATVDLDYDRLINLRKRLDGFFNDASPLTCNLPDENGFIWGDMPFVGLKMNGVKVKFVCRNVIFNKS